MGRVLNVFGFILPTTLMVMTLLTVMLSAAFVMVSAEFRASDNALAQSRATSLAQAGIQDYFSRNRAISSGTTYDSLRITYSAGYADVVARRLVPVIGSRQAIWLVRSTGSITGSVLSGQVQAQRTVAQFSTFNPGVLPVKAAFVAGNQIVFINTGLPAPITGSDSCGALDSAGLVVTPANMVGDHSGMVIRTFPPNAVLDSTHIDWSSLVAGNFTPDYNVPPFPGAAAMTTFPILYSSGNLSLSAFSTGRGILVVKGDLSIGVWASWSGIILVGGRVTAAGFSLVNIQGTVVTGLNNITTPNSVGPDTIPRGWPGFQWNSCDAASAAASQGAMAPLRHTFIDTWATY